MREREALTARISQIRRAWASGDERRKTDEAQAASVVSGTRDLPALHARVTELEAMLEGLQDSVHRESTRLHQRLSVVEAQLKPAALGRALSEDARERGL